MYTVTCRYSSVTHGYIHQGVDFLHVTHRYSPLHTSGVVSSTLLTVTHRYIHQGVDFLHAFVMEVRRDGEPMLFCVERAMEEGGYVKYNNNSGFVEYAAEGVAQAHRLTPHAFSRFTFDESRGELMVIDIQVIGNL